LDEVTGPQVEIDDINIHHDDPAPIEGVPTQVVHTPERSAPVVPPAQASGIRTPKINESQESGESYVHTKHIVTKYSYAVTQLDIQ
jgi:hypothetical protein